MHSHTKHRQGRGSGRGGMGASEGPGRGGPGRGGHGGGPGRGRHGGPFAKGRKLSSDELQLVILSLLEEKPAHGYELIKQLETRSHGFYVPSPGVIYPSLTYLEEIGFVSVEAEGARKLNRLTGEGARHLGDYRADVAAILAGLEKMGERMEAFRRFEMDGEGGGGGDDRGPGPSPALRQSFRALREALFQVRDASGDTETRLREILDRATGEVRALDATTGEAGDTDA